VPTLEDIKSLTERLTGIGRPDTVVPRRRKANALLFRDDGETPNNPLFPFILYRSPVRLEHGFDPAAVLEVLFAANGWKPAWRDGIYNYNHFHTKTHEVLGIARGHARVRFGGGNGRTIEVRAGDVFVHPAGVGHRRLSASKDLLVVGAYPRGGSYNEPRPGEIDHAKAIREIAKVGVPPADPVYGSKGPLIAIWTKAYRARRRVAASAAQRRLN
jgi:uncharacterized protein YjlB